MSEFEVTFKAEIEVVENIVADNLVDAIARGQRMANESEVGEHKLDLDWEITDVKPVSVVPDAPTNSKLEKFEVNASADGGYEVGSAF